MPEETEKGFVIKDKRSLDETGTLKADAAKSENEEKGSGKKGMGKKASRKNTEMPLPEINFPALIFSLSSTALFHLGELPDPQTHEKKKDIPLAKHAIDTIAMLKEKTKGNLTGEEEKFIETVLADLRLRYVKEKG